MADDGRPRTTAVGAARVKGGSGGGPAGASDAPIVDEQQELPDLVRDLVDALGKTLEQRGTPDAEMLRLVMRAREALRDVDDALERLQRYFTAGPS